MKIVVNKCFGGFRLSLKAQKRLAELMGKELYFYKQTKHEYADGKNQYKKITDIYDNSLFIYAVTKDMGEKTNILYNDKNDYFYANDIERTNKLLIQVVEELEDEANGSCAKLRIIEIPDGIEWEIDEYDGIETVHEVHRSW